MNCEIICRRGQSYLVRQDGVYKMVSLTTGTYSESAEPGVFLKLGYFEDVERPEATVLEGIAVILADPDARTAVI